jgi:hypothetical protein
MMDIMDPSKKYLTYFEYAAAHLYYSDIKLHLLMDQADSGFLITDGEWDAGIEDPLKELNFKTLWAKLDEEKKQFYIKLAHHNFNDEPEIKHR